MCLKDKHEVTPTHMTTYKINEKAKNPKKSWKCEENKKIESEQWFSLCGV